MSHGARRALAGAAVVLALAACADDGLPRTVEPPPRGPEARSLQRPQTKPARLRVVIPARPPSRRLVVRAVSDLKRLGFWTRLTRHLDELRLGTQAGAHNVPPDGHLADAFLTARMDPAGTVCDISFYPAAIRRDLRRQAEYYADGLLDEPPASARRFWVSIFAHELAHCLPTRSFFRQRGEGTARRWEHRVLQAARREL